MNVSYRVAPWFDIKKRKPIYWVQKRVGILWFNAYEDGQALKFDSEMEAKTKIARLLAEAEDAAAINPHNGEDDARQGAPRLADGIA